MHLSSFRVDISPLSAYLRSMENYYLNMASGNKKTGIMPVSTSHKGTCPDSCPFKVKGCYAKSGPLAFHWNKVTEGVRGVVWTEFLAQVRKIPKGTLFRHNQSGDLVGNDDLIDKNALRELTSAVKKIKAYGYTHYPLNAENVEALTEANENGFTINVSTNNIREVDDALATGLPVVTVLPVETVARTVKTEKNNTVLVCPASRGVDITCIQCGLCQQKNRKFAIGFVAHGTGKKNLGK